MEQEKPESNAGETMVYGLIDQADRIGKTALATQRALTEQIQELAQVQAWAVEAAVDLQNRANAAIKSLETERAKLADDRAKLQAIGPTIEQGAVSAMRETLREQAGQIKYAMKTEVSGVFAESLRDIQAGAGHVRKNVKETSWLMIGLVLIGGLVIGFLFAYWPLKSSQNTMQEQLNRIQQTLDAQQSPGSVPAATDTHTPDHHKGKAK
jgi:hypothetical protein